MKKPFFTLRKYQSDFLDNLSKAVAKNKKVIACAPTGSGKTKTFIQIAYNAIQKGRAVIIISESKKIFEQITKEAGGHEIANGVRYVDITNGELYVAMAQTLVRRQSIIERINSLNPQPIIIIDEAHIGHTTTIINRLTDPILIGFTATPDARVAKHLPKTYKDCVVACQVDDLIQSGNLCSYRHHARDKANTSLLKMRNGDFSEASQIATFDTPVVYDGLVDDLKKFKFNKCMVFVSSIKHCDNLYDQLHKDGFDVVRYHSMIEDADFQLARFTELDDANICISVSSLTKGFDFPDIDLIAIMRATTSLPLYLQMIGRGSRPAPSKSTFQVIDYGDNWKRHGLYWDDREWTALWKDEKKKRKGDSDGVAPITMCVSCQAIISSNKRICDYCNAEQPVTEKELEQGELIEVTSHYNGIVGKYISQLSPKELSIYAKMKSKQRFAARVARAMEQEKNGYIHSFAREMGYKQKWTEIQLSQIGTNKIDFTDFIIR